MTLGSGIESDLIIDIAFWVISASTIIAAVAVVQLRDLFRAALFLVVAFFGVAGMFILLRAEFLAVVQVLIYVGAISVLIIFAVLMTRDVEEGNPSNRLRIPAGVLAVLFFVATAFVAVNSEWDLIDDAMLQLDTVPQIAQAGGQMDDGPAKDSGYEIVDLYIGQTSSFVKQTGETAAIEAMHREGVMSSVMVLPAPSPMGGLTRIDPSAPRRLEAGEELTLADLAVNSELTSLDDRARPDASASSERKPLSDETVQEVERVFSNTVPYIAGLLLRDFVLAFEVASVLLLGAIIGALALVREQQGGGGGVGDAW